MAAGDRHRRPVRKWPTHQGYGSRLTERLRSSSRTRSGARPWIGRRALPTVVSDTEQLVRLAIRQAVGGVANGKAWPPDWDRMILEGAKYL
jgi:hypothetical protein